MNFEEKMNCKPGGNGEINEPTENYIKNPGFFPKKKPKRRFYI